MHLLNVIDVEKNDRTKASYWSCRLPRYASQLGLGANMNTFW